MKLEKPKRPRPDLFTSFFILGGAVVAAAYMAIVMYTNFWVGWPFALLYAPAIVIMLIFAVAFNFFDKNLHLIVRLVLKSYTNVRPRHVSNAGTSGILKYNQALQRMSPILP